MSPPRTPPLTSTSYAILGLLALQPWTTYELAKQVQRSIGWFWPRAERKLYDEPKRLVEAGYATSTSEMTGARPRTVYAITDDGRAALRRWLDEPPVPPALEFEGLVKVFFSDAGSLDQMRATLQAIADEADRRLIDLDAKRSENVSGDVAFPARLPINALGLRLMIEHERATREWAHWALEQVAEWRSPNDPGAWDHRSV